MGNPEKSVDEVKTEANTEAARTMDEDDNQLARMGHKAQLHRQYGLLSVSALGVVACNSWSALGGTLVAGIFAGGSATVIYGWILVTFTNAFLALSLAELSSGYPTAGGAYHWAASLATPEWAPVVSFLTGYLNLFAWIIGTAGSDLFLGQYVLGLYSLTHPDFIIERWMVFLAFQGWNVLVTLVSIYGNKIMPIFIRFALFWTMTACVICSIVMLAMSSPKNNARDVFASFSNETGWASSGIAVCVGLLNPAFGYAAIDSVIHYAEEAKDATRTIPKALFAVIGGGFISGLFFLLAAFFSITDFNSVLSTSTGVPVIEIFRQATGSLPGGLGLSLMLFFASAAPLFDCQVATSRLAWALGRDDALPLSKVWKTVHPGLGVPVCSSLLVGVCIALLGCIYIGNSTAFNAFLSSSIVLNNLTYAVPILTNMIRGRSSSNRGWFFMSGYTGWIVNTCALVWILFTLIFFEFPSYQPVTVVNMNYTVVVLGSCVILSGIWWFAGGRKHYKGPVEDVIDVTDTIVGQNVHHPKLR